MSVVTVASRALAGFARRRRVAAPVAAALVRPHSVMALPGGAHRRGGGWAPAAAAARAAVAVAAAAAVAAGAGVAWCEPPRAPGAAATRDAGVIAASVVFVDDAAELGASVSAERDAALRRLDAADAAQLEGCPVAAYEAALAVTSARHDAASVWREGRAAYWMARACGGARRPWGVGGNGRGPVRACRRPVCERGETHGGPAA